MSTLLDRRQMLSLSAAGALASVGLGLGGLPSAKAAPKDASSIRYCFNTSTIRGQNLTIEEEVEEVLETLRPALISDGGNVELVAVDEGVVKVRLVGACATCSSSLMTLKMGLERALKKAIPMVRCIEQVQ